MDLLLIALLLLAVGAVVVVALGKVGGGLAPVPTDVVPPLDDQVSTASDLDRARFSLALRGYRMDQVDQVLDETRDLLAAKDEEIGRLRRRLAPSVDLSVDRGSHDDSHGDADDHGENDDHSHGAQPVAGAPVEPSGEPTRDPTGDPAPISDPAPDGPPR